MSGVFRGLPFHTLLAAPYDWPDAIERVYAEVAPILATADELHDLLSSTVVLRPRNEWRGLWEELLDRGRGRSVMNDGIELWTTAEVYSAACEALSGIDSAVVRVLRGHLELSGVTSVKELSTTTTLPEDAVSLGLMALEHEGFAMQGHYRSGSSGTEWVARR